jgi:hypothetical protein
MGTQAKFGIQTEADVSQIKTLQVELAKIPELLKAWQSGMTAFAPVVEKTFTAAGAAARAGATKTGAQVAEIAVQIAQKTAEASRTAQEQVRVATERRIKFEKEAEEKKYEDAKEKYKELVTAHQNMTTAMQESTSKEVKAELKEQLAALKAEKQAYADNIRERPETKAGKSSDVGMHGTGRETTGLSVKGAVEIAGVGAAVEGLSVLVEKSKEVSEANRALIAGTHETGDALEKEKKNSEEVGQELGKTGAEVQTAMGHTAAWTHATGEELKKQTEAVVAFEAVHGVSAEKLMKTEEGRAKVFAEAAQNIAGAQMAAQDPALQAELAQKNVMEMVGKLANILLTALAPILKEVSPLLGELGEIAASVLTPALSILGPILEMIVTGLNFLMPILKPLIVVVGLVTAAVAAMNVVMLVNPFVLIAVAIVALIGIIVTMVKHWDDVVATLKKVWSAISDAGGAVLSFLGITGKAEAATRKHTDSLKDNKKSLEDIKKAEEDAAKATSDYTDELKKNQEEQDKSAKEGQDNAIAAIVDIQRRLKTATGSEKAELETRLAQWQAYGKKQVATQEESEAAKHKAALAIGAAVDNDQKAAKDKTAKIDKDAYTAEKNAEEIRFNQDRLDLDKRLAAKTIKQDAYNKKLEDLESDHATKLKDIAANHRKGHEQDAIAAESAFVKLQIANNNKEIEAEKKKQEEIQKLAEKREKVLIALQYEASKSRIAAIADENERAIAEENARYEEELSVRTEDLMDMKTGKLVAEALETNHQNKLSAIQEQGEDKRRDEILKSSQMLAGPIANAVVSGFHKMMSGAEAWTKKMSESDNVLENIFGNILSGFLTMIEGMIEKIVAMEAILLVANLIPGFAAFAKTLDTMSSLIPGHAEGTDSSPGGWHFVGERGVELVNMNPGAQVIPNHRLPQVTGATVDLSPLAHKLDLIHNGLNRANDTFATRPAPVLPVNDRLNGMLHQAANAETRRAA